MYFSFYKYLQDWKRSCLAAALADDISITEFVYNCLTAWNTDWVFVASFNLVIILLFYINAKII